MFFKFVENISTFLNKWEINFSQEGCFLSS